MSADDDRALRALYRAGTATPPPGPHPSPEAIAEAVDRRADAPVRLAVLDHVMQCPSCRADYDLLRAARDAAGAPRVRRSPVGGLVGAAAAAAILVVLLVRPSVPGSSPTSSSPASSSTSVPIAAPGGALAPPPAGVDRGGSGAGAGATLIAPLGSVAATTNEFVWHRRPGATSYRVEAVDDSGAVVSSADVRDTVAPLPAAGLVPGRSYRWWTTARDRDGATHRSDVATFVISP